MMIDAPKKDMSEPKTLKVTVPARLYLQLHQLKILTGQNISSTVEGAVRDYLADLESPEDVGGEPA